MKNNTPFASLSTEQLIEQKKKLTGIFLGLGIVNVSACSFLFYQAIVSHKPALMAVAICCGMTFLPAVVRLTQLKKEIKSRETSAG